MTGVFVLGMHRSGTSATTRAINLLGVPLARHEALIPPSPNNPTGFWEVARLTAFNNELLAELGGSSMGPPLLEEGWARRSELERRRSRARRLFEQAHATPSWVWKDPRNCVTFPFWVEALDVPPVAVVVHREPDEVARSLSARQGLSGAMSRAVWERYTRAALGNARGLPAYVTRYADLVDSPEAWALEIGSFLRDRGLPVEPDRGASEVQAFVGGGGDQRPPVDSTGRTSVGTEEPGGAESAAVPGESAPQPSDAQRALAEAVESLVG
ncbi:MAG TPA: hypothetical protein VGR10_00815, partial [Thermoleophilaceae bacterium]|nr:hypothetical protein [Thermoleophilaceae bacterium]